MSEAGLKLGNQTFVLMWCLAFVFLYLCSASGEFAVLWKTPMRGEMRLALSVEFSERTEIVGSVATRGAGGAAIQTWRVKAIDPLPGQTIRIRGLESTMTDALVRVEFIDGTTWTQRLTPRQPTATIPLRQSGLAVTAVYFKLGIEHILAGMDHLLFVLALLIISRGGWMIVKTITAFTLAHSITLTAATLGFVHVPQPPVEAVIALSIAFVAAEILHGLHGREGVAARAPWIVALTFGLLHGLGFAGALSEIGLPEGRIPLALLFFNVGVEVGQLLFIGGVLILVAAARRAVPATPYWARLAPPYVIGTLAMFWVFQRIATF